MSSRKCLILLSVCATLLAGCHSKRQGIVCNPIVNVTRVEISPPHDAQIPPWKYDVIDPTAVKRLVQFANGRRECDAPFDTMPAPNLTAAFYDHDNFVGAIGSGSNFFFVSCANGKGLRDATESEIKEFQDVTLYSAIVKKRL